MHRPLVYVCVVNVVSLWVANCCAWWWSMYSRLSASAKKWSITMTTNSTDWRLCIQNSRTTILYNTSTGLYVTCHTLALLTQFFERCSKLIVELSWLASIAALSFPGESHPHQLQCRRDYTTDASRATPAQLHWSSVNIACHYWICLWHGGTQQTNCLLC